jgi:hypothetical protein
MPFTTPFRESYTPRKQRLWQGKMAINTLFLALAIPWLLSLCSTRSPMNPLGELEPVLGLSAQGQANSIILTFYSANDEDNFDGFNVYISESNNVASGPDGRSPLTPTGSEPTLQARPKDMDTNKKWQYTVKYSDNQGSPLSTGVEYYFVIRAHSSKGRVSAPSNEVSASLDP